MKIICRIFRFGRLCDCVKFQSGIYGKGVSDEIRYLSSVVTTMSTKDDVKDKIEAKAKCLKDRPTERPFTVAVEGNIGCGKTTFLNHFAINPDIKIYSEPVSKWRNLKGINLLGLMYDDPEKWGLTFQTYVQFTMTQIHNQIQKEPVKMLERSIHSAKYCFVENLYRSGKMPKADYLVLGEWFDWLIQNTNTDVDLFVYLRTRPEVVYERVKARARPEENAIPLNFFEVLHELHEDWLIKKKCFPVSAPVFVLDVNCDLQNIRPLYDQAQQHILLSQKINTTNFTK